MPAYSYIGTVWMESERKLSKRADSAGYTRFALPPIFTRATRKIEEKRRDGASKTSQTK